jgi:beta-glucosidase
MPSPFAAAVERVREGAAADAAAADLVDLLTAAEKLSLLDGDEPFWPGMPRMQTEGYNHEPYVAGSVERLGIPGVRFADGPRGAVIGRSTCFPVPMARGATWDPELEERVGAAIGAEIRAQGGNYFGGVCINLLRHPAWGRAQETYGEEPALLGAMGAALARGAQRHVMACVKHYACNSMENARFSVDVEVDERALHEVYLPHFRAVVEAGVASVMSAYNSVNGEWCGQNRVLLTDILRDEWGFEGFVVSDFIFGLRDAAASLRAGLDIEMPFAQQRVRDLPAALEADPSLWEDVDRSGRRILATQLRFAASTEEAAPGVVFSAEHLALAREAATKAIVLLRNEAVAGAPVLPLDGRGLRRLAVAGRLAGVPNTGDHGSSDVRPPKVVTPIEALREALAGAEVVHDPDWDGAAAAAAAAEADAAVVVVGYTAEDEGEYIGAVDAAARALLPPSQDGSTLGDAILAGGQAAGGDRDRLSLHADDEALIAAVAAANPRTIVVIMAGSAVIVERWRASVPGILVLWYPGSEGGRALADVLLGAADPGGRLPFVVPTDPAHLPYFDKAATRIVYDRWHGQRLLDRDGHAPAFPLGFGLSYTAFALSNLEAAADGERLGVAVTAANTGERPGGHVVQVYARGEHGAHVLLGFRRVELQAGASERVQLSLPLTLLGRRAPGRSALVVDPGTYELEVGAHAGDPAALSAAVELPS